MCETASVGCIIPPGCGTQALHASDTDSESEAVRQRSHAEGARVHPSAASFSAPFAAALDI